MHLSDQAPHDLNRAGRSGHDARSQTGQIKGRELGMIQFHDEHGRHAVECRASLFLNGCQRIQGIKGLSGKNHGGTMGHTGQHRQHHAKAVVERHRYTQSVLWRQVHRGTRQVAVIEDVAVGQGCPLGLPVVPLVVGC